MSADLQEDIKELQQILENHATRKKVKQILKNEIASLEFKLKAMGPMEVSPQAKETKPVSKQTLNVKRISEYSWAQSKGDLQFFINLPGSKGELRDDQQLSMSVLEKSLEIIVQDPVSGFKFIFSLNGLAYQLDTKQSTEKSVVLKKKGDSLQAVATVKKDKKGDWRELLEKDLKQKDAEKDDLMPKGDSSDPADLQKSLMGLMKKLYDEGDDQMKQQISKSMYESFQKGGQPGFGGF